MRIDGRTVDLVHSSPNRSVAQIAKELGVSDNSLRSWVKQFEIDQGEREGLTTEGREDLRRLRNQSMALSIAGLVLVLAVMVMGASMSSTGYSFQDV